MRTMGAVGGAAERGFVLDAESSSRWFVPAGTTGVRVAGAWDVRRQLRI